MLTAEHGEAEVLRRARLQAYAPRRSGRVGLRWFFKLLGWQALDEDPTMLRVG
jgi:hypothetical protein